MKGGDIGMGRVDTSNGHLWLFNFFVSLKGALGCAQSDSLPPLQAVVLDPCSSHSCHGDACGLQGLAGL